MNATGLSGLDEVEAARRLLATGPNELPHPGSRSLFRIVLETMREPMFLLLAAAACLYLVLGDLGEGLFLVAGATASIALVVMQEARSERALTALRDLAQPMARVIRGGVERRIPARELVPDDILLVGEGERFPSDAWLIGGEVLSVDESALTGESAPVAKTPAAISDRPAGDPTPGAESSPHLFAGTLVVRGQGVARVTHTGSQSALGRIGASLAEIVQEPTPLQRRAGRVVAILGAFALAFCLLVAVAYGILRQDWLGGTLAGVTVAIGLIPEEFPMVLAVFLALGAWRLATHQVLTRRAAVIETLGGATILCADKTGTLTENRMRVQRLWTESGELEMSPDIATTGAADDLLQIAALASAVRPVDPMDRAIRAVAVSRATGDAADSGPERAWPLRPDLMAVIQIWREADNSRVAAAKGAPEAIFGLCRLHSGKVDLLQGVVQAFAEQGLRVLGVASARPDGGFGEDPRSLAFEFKGLIGFLDPLREGVPAAVGEARAAGISVMMITGDHPATALAISRAAGLDLSGGVLAGPDLAVLSFEALCEKLRTVRVCARIVPAQKLRIVEALRANGEIVAMTGDGVNDAPALEAAHIGIAMGRRGTDVAREAADLVLLDDNFASIVGGVRLGRRIFTNLRRALVYITAIHIPIAGLALAPILLGLPPMLYPMHVVLMELAIDPICALVFEAEPSAPFAMKLPPRRASESLFGGPQLVAAGLQGLGVLAGTLAVYVWALGHQTEDQARGAAFASLVFGNLVLALADSTGSGSIFAAHRRMYWIIALAVASLMGLVLFAPVAAGIFRISAPDRQWLLIALVVAGLSGGWLKGVRIVRRRFRPKPVLGPLPAAC